MKMFVLIGLAAASVASVASAEVFTFAHTLEVAGRLRNTPLGSVEIPYQSMHGEADISITEGIEPVAHEYGYESDPEFHVAIDGTRTDFAVLFTQGRGESIADDNAPGMWNLHMSFVPVAIIGGEEYRLPGVDGAISFIRPHQDPQPLPLGGGDEELRHGTPVVFLIESPIVLWAGGDDSSDRSFTIDAASRIIIEEQVVPMPSGVALCALTFLRLNSRRRRA